MTLCKCGTAGELGACCRCDGRLEGERGDEGGDGADLLPSKRSIMAELLKSPGRHPREVLWSVWTFFFFFGAMHLLQLYFAVFSAVSFRCVTPP